MTEDKYSKYRRIFIEHNGILRASNAVKLGVPQHIIYEMLQKKVLIREARGIYSLADMEPPGNPDLVQASLLIPKGIICLISALYYYDLTTQIPHQIHVALPRNTKTPKIEYPPIRVFHFGEKSYSAGVEDLFLDGVNVRIYSREKTIADCFAYREKIGIETAVEALKDYFQRSDADPGGILKYAGINRVEKVMNPYIRALI